MWFSFRGTAKSQLSESIFVKLQDVPLRLQKIHTKLQLHRSAWRKRELLAATNGYHKSQLQTDGSDLVFGCSWYSMAGYTTYSGRPLWRLQPGMTWTSFMTVFGLHTNGREPLTVTYYSISYNFLRGQQFSYFPKLCLNAQEHISRASNKVKGQVILVA